MRAATCLVPMRRTRLLHPSLPRPEAAGSSGEGCSITHQAAVLGPIQVPPTRAWICPPPERTQSRQWGERARDQGFLPPRVGASASPVTQAPGDITHSRLQCQPSGEVLQRVLPSTRGPAISAALSPFPPTEGPCLWPEARLPLGWFWPEIEDRPLRFGSGRGDSLFFLSGRL